MLKRIALLVLMGASLLHAAPIKASFYANFFEGRKMANGSIYHARTITAASLTYPLNSIVNVVNLETGKVLHVRITDRGPYSHKYSLDLSIAAARALGITRRAGWGWVEVMRDDILPQPDNSLEGLEIPLEPVLDFE